VTGGRYVWTAGRYPQLRRDRRRRLRQGGAELAADRCHARIRFERNPDALAMQRPEITQAYKQRNADAGRDIDEDWLDRAWAAAGELATLRIGGQLAAWDLAVPGPVVYRVLAGQMVPGFERYRPGQLLEAALVARVVTDPAFPVLDWGPGHPGALLTAGAGLPGGAHVSVPVRA
jgi:Acetyltransferase (GNAT) domain